MASDQGEASSYTNSKGTERDFSMAILERKKVANQLVVDEAVNVDNSVVSLNPKTMKKMQLFCANAIQLKAGYYCSVCECVVKDSAIYLDHNNEKKHQRALGMSMRVERASLQQVMTPKPECGTIDTPILDALHTMHNGKFLHLPVLDRDGIIVSVIDVIHVTHAAVAIVQERFESLKKRKVLETFTE